MFRIFTAAFFVALLPMAAIAGVMQRDGQHDWPSDLNGDGKVSLSEMQTACRQVVMVADTDSDGRISVREWADAARTLRQRVHDLGLRGWKPSSDDIFVRVDTDRDGYVTADEIDAATIRRFNRRDVNQDGFISRDEAARDLLASKP